MTGQIEQLQNAVANQRITASRTALDDGEYSTRFNRLNGAVNNMAFNIRKDWRLVPRWLDRYVSQDALKTGKQEMTAVGRAVITRWIVEEVFNRCFHPGLDPELSRRLKEIELGIRRNSYTLTSQEEFDALTSKVVSWRMATLDGLSAELNSPAAADVRAEFTARATESLLATLTQYLDDPPPAGIEGSASMIMELAVGIAANMPLESRDVVIRYPLPGDPVEAGVMEVEKGGLPPLEGVPDEEEGEGDEKNGGKEKRKGEFLFCFSTILFCFSVPRPLMRAFPSGSCANVCRERCHQGEARGLRGSGGPRPAGSHEGPRLDALLSRSSFFPSLSPCFFSTALLPPPLFLAISFACGPFFSTGICVW